jgi:hypothetical protein
VSFERIAADDLPFPYYRAARGPGR